MAQSPFDVIVIGGGAAGLMCAMEAGRRGRRVAVLENNSQIGRKIMISGGGRCNFTNVHTRPENFVSANPHFAKSALARYRPENFLALIRKHHIPYHEKTLGQLFCDRSANDIVSLLETECSAVGVRIETAAGVRSVRCDSRFAVETGVGFCTSDSLVVATGGLSIPKLGATSFGYDLARQFGLGVIPCRPGLVPLVLQPGDLAAVSGLAGVSLEVLARCGAAQFREKMLFTHRGLSGPAILQISSYWAPGQEIEIDLLPGVDTVDLLCARRTRGESSEVRAIMAAHLPKRLAAAWFAASKPAAMLSDREIQAISDRLHTWRIIPAGTEGYGKAEVTMGGVDTAELSSKTFEAQKIKGLYFIGEVLDVTGQLGGFNFQWAWASGHAAGQFV
ncbi:MAG: aminoacetone oxidase family FAD-binding enzyme [Terriglobia bacterium]|nr:MAG: aminoacetone oxidase family FAD-binding enzyme [Terriglobia bacterium]